MIRSIRLTLTVWYVGILTLIICVFGFVLYGNVSVNLYHYNDRVLLTQAEGLAAALYSFWEAEWEAKNKGWLSKKPAESRQLQKEVEAGRLPDLITRWAKETGGMETVRPIRMLDRNGEPIAYSANFWKLNLPISKSAAEQGKVGKTFYETFPLGGNRFRMITRPVVEDSRILFLIQIASSLDEADTSLDRLKKWLLVLIPFTIVLASAVGWFFAGLALRPVDKMTGQAKKIGAQDLHQRIDVPPTGDELERLAVTFNDMLARLERAFRRMRQFSAAASHELRTPLTIIKGELEVALRRPRDAEEYQRVLQTQLEALHEMIYTVEQLLTLAQSEEGEGAIERLPVELGKLTKQLTDKFETIAEQKKIHIEVKADKPVWVRGEKRLLERLIVNLLDNAFKHSLPETEVRLEVTRVDRLAKLVVQDQGAGIPPDEIGKIFQKFFTRREPGDNPKSTGLGLGLCRWIAEAHQGQIEVQSTPGKGSVFTVSLPVTELPQTVPAY